MPTDIFISYASPDLEFVQRLHQQLTERGFSAWFDQNNEETGFEHTAEIKQVIQTAKVLLFVASPDAIASPKARSEISTAYENFGKPFITLTWQPPTTRPPRAMQSLLVRASTNLDFAGEASVANFEQLFQILSRHAPAQGEAAVAAGPAQSEATTAPKRRLSEL